MKLYGNYDSIDSSQKGLIIYRACALYIFFVEKESRGLRKKAITEIILGLRYQNEPHSGNVLCKSLNNGPR